MVCTSASDATYTLPPDDGTTCVIDHSDGADAAEAGEDAPRIDLDPAEK